MLKYILTDNGTQIVSKFFATMCPLLGIRHLESTAYHPQTNCQAERVKKTILLCFRHYDAEHQKE